MKLMTKEQLSELLRNGDAWGEDHDHPPVVKWFTPDADCTWLIGEVDTLDPDRAFGLCDLGMGRPELGWVRVSDIEKLTGPTGLHVERDMHIVLDRPMSEYAEAARMRQRITTLDEDLDAAKWLDEEVKKCEADPSYLPAKAAFDRRGEVRDALIEADEWAARVGRVMDAGTDGKRSFRYAWIDASQLRGPCSRGRVAYLLRAARSRGANPAPVGKVGGNRGYIIGNLVLHPEMRMAG